VPNKLRGKNGDFFMSWKEEIKKEVGEEFKPFENNMRGFLKEVARLEKSLEEMVNRGGAPIPSRADKYLRNVFRVLDVLDDAIRDVIDEVGMMQLEMQ
jgi:hypothetical protein